VVYRDAFFARHPPDRRDRRAGERHHAGGEELKLAFRGRIGIVSR
jgi:hypothetical protein